MVSAHDQFSLYDIGCAALVLLPLIIVAGIIAFGLLLLISPAHATTVNFTPTVDGYAGQTTDANWYVMRNGAGEESGTTDKQALAPLDALNAAASGTATRLIIFSFNTSSIPDDATINNATLIIRFIAKTAKSTGTANVTITGGVLGSNTTIANGDYDGWTSTEYTNRIEYADISTSVNSNFIFNAVGLAGISKTSYTVLYLRSGYEVLNTSPPWVSSGQAIGITTALNENDTVASRPVLEVTYTSASSPPVSNFTSNVTTGANSLSVQFNDSSTNTPTSWQWYWYLNETVSSTQQNPVATFAPGLYPVRLHTANAESGNWKNVTSYINVTGVTMKTGPTVMFTFDDGWDTVYTDAYPAMSAFGIKGTAYVVPTFDSDARFMPPSEQTTLYNDGWDIASHGNEHTNLLTVNSSEQVRIIQKGQQNLSALGYTRSAYHLAYPFGGYDAGVLTSAASVGTLTGRTINKANLTIPYTNVLSLPLTQLLDEDVSYPAATTYVSSRDGTNQTVIFLLHRVSDTPDPGTYTIWPTTDLRFLSNWIYNNGYPTTTISQWYQSNTLPPITSFTVSNQTPCSLDTVQFNDTSTNTPTAWDWRWWDNETTSSTLQNPTYQFPPGEYNVRLYASNVGGGSWENKTAFVNSTTNCFSQTDASFTSNVTCGNIPFTVQFNDTSSGTPTIWNWSFGDGNYSNIQNPAFRYNASGLFTINFSANNTANVDWMNRSGYIRAVPNWANCPPTPTPTPTWGPEIMPSTDNEIASPSWVDYMISFWWVWLLLVVGYILVKK
jgi:PKD repeat protein